MKLIPIIEGGRQQTTRYSLDETARILVEAHRRGQRWDARVATTGLGYRILTEDEAEQLTAAMAAILADDVEYREVVG